jgi:ATP-dependent DNA helicase RecG
MTRVEISTLMGIHDEKHFQEMYQQVAIKLGYIEMTIPDKLKSRFQKYRLTNKGIAFQNNLKL